MVPEKESNSKIKVLLIGDTHPEIIAIAKNLAGKNIDYRVVLPTYFTVPESRLLSRFAVGVVGLKPWLEKRTLDPSISSDSLIRKYAILETFTWLFKRFRLHGISWKFANLYNHKITNELHTIITSYSPDVVVSYDTKKVPRSKRFKHIVICPMSHPAAVAESLNQSKDSFPNWPEMEDEKPLGIDDTAKYADRVVLLSQFAKSTYISQGFDASQLEVIHIGPINGNKNASSPIKSHKTFLRILFLGRMTRVKGVEALARLSHLVDPMNFQISLVGQCSPRIASYINEISNSKVLQLFENPSPDQISKHFLNSDIFALPSFNEGFNIASLEAMSYGLVPILSKNTGVSEILENTSLAKLIVEPGNIGQLQERLNYLHNLDRFDFYELSKASFELSKMFSFERFAEDFVKKMLHELIE